MVSKATKRKVSEFWQHKCAVCENNDYLEFHHLISKKKGGSDDIDNIILLCARCHATIHGRTFDPNYEAAQIDGAGKMAQMKYVVLPSILSTIVIMLITRIGSLLNVGYEKVLLLYNPNTYVTADVVSTFAQRYGITDGLVGIASAAEMLNNVVGMLLVIAANTIARKASDVSLY